MRVLNLQVHNIMKVSELKLPMDGRNLVLIGGKNGQGKCIPEGTDVALWDGTSIPIEQVRDYHDVVGYDFETNRFSSQKIIGLHYNGLKPCYRLKTKSGHEIVATANHRLVGENGWRELCDFYPGDSIAVPVRLPCKDESTSHECSEAALIGLLLGDGCLARGISFTVADNGVKAMFLDAARKVFPEIEPSVVRINRGKGLDQISVASINGSQREGSPSKWLDDLGLKGLNSFTKFVPERLFKFGKRALCCLIAGLFATDGYIVDGELAQFAVRSEALARGCWRALLRVGVPASFRVAEKLGKPCYFVSIGRFGWNDFESSILPLIPASRIRSRTHRVDGEIRSRPRKDRGTGKGRLYLLPPSAAKLLHANGANVGPWAKKNRSIGVDVFEREVQLLESPCSELTRMCSTDVCFSVVESIELVGDRQTFDLEMPTGAFVANDFVVHNSSAIRALLMALCGKRGMDFPDVVLKEGEDHGWVKVDLSGDEDLGDLQGLTIEMGFRRRRGGKIEESFRLLDSTGEEAPEPRKLLSSLYSLRAFDPLAFEKAKPKEQVELIRRLLGLDFEEEDKEYDRVFAERTQVNRQLKELEARRSAIRVPANAPKEKVSVSALVKELDAAREVNDKVDKEFEKLGKSDSMLEKLDSDIVKARQALAKLESDFSEATIANNEQRAKCANLVKCDTSEIQKRIESSEELNAAYDLKVSADQLDKQIRETVRKADDMTDALEDIKAKKQKAMEEAKWPVPGMSLDDNGVLLDGLPFEQASRAQRIRTSVKIEMAAKPKLRLMVSQDGSDCDMDTLNELEAICKENDYQLIMEFVTRSEADEELCAVVFEDGQAK